MSVHSRVFGGRRADGALDDVSKAEEAELLARATNAAVIAAKSILLSGGSEDMAVRTAKAAAFSVFCPNLSEDEINSRKASSYLKRRQFKKQAEVVASVALITAKAQSMEVGNDERDQSSSCERNAEKTKRASPLDRALEKVTNGPNKMSASSVVSGKTGPTAVTAGISTSGEQSSAHYVRIRQMDEPSAITNPTKFDEASACSDPSETKRPTSSFVQETREKIRRRNNPKKVEVEEHPMKLNMARKQKQKQQQKPKVSEETNWFENMTNTVNIAWAILTCGHDCAPPPVETSTKTGSKDEGTLVTRTGMEIKCEQQKDQISTVTPCPAQKPQGAQPAGNAARGSEAPVQYRSFPDYRDDAEDGGSHSDSLVERWSQSAESENSSIDESVSRLMHSFSSNQSDEIKIRSALRETMERVVERSKHRRTAPVNIDGEPAVVSYVIHRAFVPEPKKSEFSVRTRKLFALLKKNGRKKLYEA
mmetsp:Transcript_35243/g.85427  ORF Transcript_35243/g.85427 Transcript_35243/m.85427 type:complete len:478 (-) Transcript_35243:1082-2515(-)